MGKNMGSKANGYKKLITLVSTITNFVEASHGWRATPPAVAKLRRVGAGRFWYLSTGVFADARLKMEMYGREASKARDSQI